MLPVLFKRKPQSIIGVSTSIAQKVFLNLITGWACIGFCEADPSLSDYQQWMNHCNEICGYGRLTKFLCNKKPKQLKG